MKFKTEILLLLGAIVLYIIGAFCYYYEAHSQGNVQVINCPYQFYAFPLLAVATVFLLIAAVLYSKRK